MWHIVHICSTCDGRTHCMYYTVKVHWFSWYERIDQGQFLQTFSLSDTCFFYAQFYIKSGNVIVEGKSVHLIKTKLLADSQEQLWHPSFVLQELEGESSKHSLYHLPEFTLVLIDFFNCWPWLWQNLTIWLCDSKLHISNAGAGSRSSAHQVQMGHSWLWVWWWGTARCHQPPTRHRTDPTLQTSTLRTADPL